MRLLSSPPNLDRSWLDKYGYRVILFIVAVLYIHHLRDVRDELDRSAEGQPAPALLPIPHMPQYEGEYAFPSFEDFPSITDDEFQKIAGQWLVVRGWRYGTPLITEMSRGDIPLEYGVQIDRNQLRFGLLDKPYGRVIDHWNMSDCWECNVIWGAYGPNSFTRGRIEYPIQQLDKFLGEINGLQVKRGRYRLDNDRLYLYWSETPRPLPELPEVIPDRPHTTDEGLLVLRRPEKPIKIDFLINRLPSLDEVLEQERSARRLDPSRPFGPDNPIISEDHGTFVIPSDFGKPGFDPKLIRGVPTDVKMMLEDLSKEVNRSSSK